MPLFMKNINRPADVEFFIRNAIDKKYNKVDIAPSYKFSSAEDEQCEKFIGNLNLIEDELRISTKVGKIYKNEKWSLAASFEDNLISIEKSFNNLKTNKIYQFSIHEFTGTEIDLRTLEHLNSLKKRGYIEQVGVCNASLASLKEISSTYDIDYIQSALNLFNRDQGMNILDFCRNNDIKFYAIKPFGGNLYQKYLNRQYVNQLKGVGNPYAVALCWLLSQSEIIYIVPGVSCLEQVDFITQTITSSNIDSKCFEEALAAIDSYKKGNKDER